MAKPLSSVSPRENGKHSERGTSSKQDTSPENSVVTLRGMLSTAEYWKDQGPSDAEEGVSNSPAPEQELSEDSRLELIQRENAGLRTLVEELERRLQDNGTGGDPGWEERQREFESLLEEKSEVIRSLHQKMQELQSRPSAPALTPREDELIALSDELERERCQLEQDRRDMEEERAQLKEDEKIMMQQMRDMEVQMARDRAELARQRNELQRLHNEVHHEMELASRDAAIRERLMPLQRRHQEMNQRKGNDPPREQAPPPQKADSSTKEKGLLGRLFG